MADDGTRRTGEAGEDAVSRARQALAAARAGARGGARGGARSARDRAAPAGPAAAGASPSPQQDRDRRGRPAAARPGFPAVARRDDPRPLSAAISGLVSDEGWGLAAATGSVFGRWAEIVGPELAAHTTPETLRDGELTVAADSTAWATQLRLLAVQLVRRLNRELGDGTVARVRVRGPVTTSRRPGEWRVRGSRGPRDTYG